MNRQIIKITYAIGLVCLLLACNNNKTDVNKNDDPGKTSHRVLSCNIRVALPQDSIKGVGWDKRKDVCIDVIKKQEADIICVQEMLKVQYVDFCKAFPAYFSFGFIGPEMDEFSEGYHGIAKNVVFFSKDRYELKSAGNYWLSETPHIAGSLSWGSARARHCNWVRIFDKYTEKEFRVMNIHLDHIAQVAKEAQIRMIIEEAKQYQEDFPQLLVGDFNANIYNDVIHLVRSAGWVDIYAEMDPENPNVNSYHGFKGLHDDSGDSGRIDFIFSFGPIKPVSSELITDKIGDMYPSDHFFLMADVEIN
ncbi:MAG: endonuclease/exonuclease/phosphatase family protein [Bacteroidales bacterium]|mgnify:CR=1 FL=1|nr:endonuclease/exonuclease/phosphatase family protein [Bacteroidales bacterium]